jgi:hypothetical protein
MTSPVMGSCLTAPVNVDLALTALTAACTGPAESEDRAGRAPDDKSDEGIPFREEVGVVGEEAIGATGAALASAMLPSRGGVEVEMNSVGPGSLAEASRRADESREQDETSVSRMRQVISSEETPQALLTLFSDLFPDPTASDLEHDLSMGYPTSPVFERSLSLSHPRLVSLDTDGHVGKHSHPAFGTLDGLDLSLDGDFGGL